MTDLPEITGEDLEPDVLPDAVRSRVVALGSAALGVLPVDEVPLALRAFARFTSTRRLRHGSAAIATALATDPMFRQRAGAKAAEEAGELGAAVSAGQVPAAAHPVDVAALAYLLRPPGWTGLVAAAAELARSETDHADLVARAAAADRSAAALERLRAHSRADLERARAEVASAKEESTRLRARVQDLTRAVKAAESEAQRAAEALATERGRAAAKLSASEAELRRVRARLADAEAEIAASRHIGREGRSAADARLWLLVESIAEGAAGLRRELALEPPGSLPADLVGRELRGPAGGGEVPVRAFAADDPARLDQLLALPRVHLVVDGYNVTKGGYGDLSLEQQRSRLVGGLAALAAQSRAEVTVVFDGAGKVVAAPPAPRGVRVLFSDPGQTADEVIRRLVRAEPAGRSIVVVSSDREVAEGVRRPGVHPVPARMLARRLERA